MDRIQRLVDGAVVPRFSTRLVANRRWDDVLGWDRRTSSHAASARRCGAQHEHRIEHGTTDHICGHGDGGRPGRRGRETPSNHSPTTGARAARRTRQRGSEPRIERRRNGRVGESVVAVDQETATQKVASRPGLAPATTGPRSSAAGVSDGGMAGCDDRRIASETWRHHWPPAPTWAAGHLCHYEGAEAVSMATARPTSFARATIKTVVPACTTDDPRGASTRPSA